MEVLAVAWGEEASALAVVFKLTAKGTTEVQHVRSTRCIRTIKHIKIGQLANTKIPIGGCSIGGAIVRGGYWYLLIYYTL